MHRTYTIGENDQTDKKLFLKIEPKVDKAEEMEKNLHVKILLLRFCSGNTGNFEKGLESSKRAETSIKLSSLSPLMRKPKKLSKIKNKLPLENTNLFFDPSLLIWPSMLLASVQMLLMTKSARFSNFTAKSSNAT